MDKDGMRKIFLDKLAIIRYDLIAKGSAKVSKDYFYTSVEGDKIGDKISYKFVDLAQMFESDLMDFAKRHNVKPYKTSDGYLFK